MTSPEGGFYSTEDADSEGHEGKYYVWALAEVNSLLGPERAKAFAYVYDVSERGNWEQSNILNLPKTIAQAAKMLGRDENELRHALGEDRARLLAAREQRVAPGKDTKVLTSWNGLMLAACAEGGRALKEERYLDAATRAAGFLLQEMRSPSGRLLHSFKDGSARFNGYLDDYANLIDGLTRLFEVTGARRWLDAALELTTIMRDEFADHDRGGFFYTGESHEALIARQRDTYDNAIPSGNAMAATALVRLGALTGREELTEAGRRALASMQVVLEKAPTAAGQSLIALDFLLEPPQEFAVLGGDDPREFRAALEAVYGRFLPHKVTAPVPPGVPLDARPDLPLLAGRSAHEGRTTTYICEQYACRAPVIGAEGVESALGRTIATQSGA
jgi:uncharacterized protein YyaL (SSP411 family)